MTEATTGLVLELTRYGAIGIIFFQMLIIIYLVYLLTQAYKQHQEMFQTSQIDSTKAQVVLSEKLQQLNDTIKNLK